MPQFLDAEACAYNSEYVTYKNQNAGPGVRDYLAACASLEECFHAGLGAGPYASDIAVQLLAEAEAERHQACSNRCHRVGGDPCGTWIESSGAEALESHSEHFNERGRSCFKHDWHITNVNQHKFRDPVGEKWLSGAEEGNTDGLYSCPTQDFEVGRSPSQRQVIKAVMEITAPSAKEPTVEQSTGLMLAQRRETALIKVAQQEEEILRQQAKLKKPRRPVVHGGAIGGDSTSTGAHQSFDELQGQIPSSPQDLRIRKLAMVRGIPEIKKPTETVPWAPDWQAVDGRADALDKSPERLLSDGEVRILKQRLMAANASEGTLPDGAPCALLKRVAAQQSRTRPSNGAQHRMLRS